MFIVTLKGQPVAVHLIKNAPTIFLKDSELGSLSVTHRVISDRVHRLLVTLSYFRPDRFVQLLSPIPILILLLYLLVSARLNRSRVYWLIAIAKVLLER